MLIYRKRRNRAILILFISRRGTMPFSQLSSIQFSIALAHAASSSCISSVIISPPFTKFRNIHGENSTLFCQRNGKPALSHSTSKDRGKYRRLFAP